jgi:branched-chain amino acid transport system substrate-binding protein
MSVKVTRRTALTGIATAAAAAAAPGTLFAQSLDPIRIAVLTDMNGPLSRQNGPGTVMGARIAAERFQQLHPEIKVEVAGFDMQNKADIVVSLARELLDEKGYDVIVDVPMSAGALAVAPMVAERDKAAFFTSAGTTKLHGAACNTNHVQWTHDTYSIPRSVVGAQMKEGGKSWFFITADSALGVSMEEQAKKFVQEAGGTVVQSIRHPFPGNTDFSSYLLEAQASGADVVGLATVAPDVVDCIKQAAEFGLTRGKQKVVALWLDFNAVTSIGLEAAQGIVLTEAFYWNQSNDPDARSFVDEFKKRHGAVPHSQQAAAFSAVWQYLNEAVKVGIPLAKRSGKAVIDSMKSHELKDPIFGTVKVQANAQAVHRMTVLRVKRPDQSTSPDDVFEVVKFVSAEEAFEPVGAGGCPLVKS